MFRDVPPSNLSVIAYTERLVYVVRGPRLALGRVFFSIIPEDTMYKYHTTPGYKSVDSFDLPRHVLPLSRSRKPLCYVQKRIYRYFALLVVNSVWCIKVLATLYATIC